MKYVIGVIGVVLLTILAIVLIVTRDTGSGTKQTGKSAVSLYETAKNGGTVTYTTEGQLVGEEERRAVRITVSSGTRKIEVIRGYNNTVEKTETYSNTQAGFEEFIKALELAGFQRKREFTTDDHRGFCPLGRRFIYEFEKSGEDSFKTWSTSCSAKEGTFGGTATTVRQLFEKQIPEYNKAISGVRL